MAAGEHQPQAVVADGGLLALLGRRRGVALGKHAQALDPVGDATLAAQAVDRPAPRRGGDPGARAGRDAVARPRRHRSGERVLEGVLGEPDVADLPDQRRENSGALLAEGPLDGVHAVAGAPTSITGRTSTVP
jgi:hypothetical protein